MVMIIITKVTDKCYEHTQECVTTLNGATIMRAVSVSTDRTILANRPDILVHDKKEKTCLITDKAIPDD